MPAMRQSRTLVDAVRPGALSQQQDILLVVAFGTLMGALAQLTVYLPFTPVPVTGQTLGVLLIGALLGSRRGAAAMLVHLAEGMAGLPVFSGGTSAWSPTAFGVPAIVGPTAGYLFAFPVAAFVVGWLAERGWDRRFGLAVAAMAIGEATIFSGGLLWLAQYVGFERVLAAGLIPFIPGDILKTIVAAMALPLGWRLLRAVGRPPSVD